MTASGVPTVKIRLGPQEVDLSAGEHVIGRASDCSICLDDPVASRCHAVLTVAATAVTVVDLRSRNGVFVNGQRIEQATALAVGDRVTVGGSTLSILSIAVVPAPVVPSGRRGSRKDYDRALRVATTLSHGTISPESPIEAFRVLGDAAGEKLAAGQAQEAESILERPLAEVLGTLRAGLPLSLEIVEYAAHLALRLARGTGSARWIDHAVDLYGALRMPMPPRIVDGIDELMDEVPGIDVAGLSTYAAAMARGEPKSAEDEAQRRRVDELARRARRAKE